MFLCCSSLSRFWYERRGQFTDEQLAVIRSTTLARVICDTGDNFTRIQEDVFAVTPLEQWKSCEDIPRLDLTPWQDCCDCKCWFSDLDPGTRFTKV
jgi:peroxidase